MQLDRTTLREDDEQEIIEKVLKRLLSNEASAFFFHAVDASLAPDYFEVVSHPICLEEIMQRAQAGSYASYRAFHADVERMVSNAFLYNEDETIGWISTCMFQHDVHEVVDEIKAAGAAERLLPEVGGAANVEMQVDEEGEDMDDA